MLLLGGGGQLREGHAAARKGHERTCAGEAFELMLNANLMKYELRSECKNRTFAMASAMVILVKR